MALLDRDAAAAAAVARTIDADGTCAVAFAVDVADERSVSEALAAAAEALGPPTILVNNAGFALDQPIDGMPTDDWDAVVDVKPDKGVTMPQYAIFTYSPAPADPMALTPDYAELLERYPAQVEELGGQIVTGFALQPSTTATSVRGDVVTDGPFVEAKEVVAGFFVLEAPDLDVALRIAKLKPVTRDGGVEVRPLFVPPAE